MLMTKRIAELLCELITEAFLVGSLFGFLVIPKQMNSFGAVLASALPVILVLFLNGYYFTRPIIGFLWGGKRAGLYACISAALFGLHMYIGFARLKPDMTPEAIGKAVFFLLGGSGIVFCCALLGKRTVLNLRSPLETN